MAQGLGFRGFLWDITILAFPELFFGGVPLDRKRKKGFIGFRVT